MQPKFSSTGLSNVAVDEIREPGLSCLLLRNTRIENHESDVIFENWTKHKTIEQIKALKIEIKMESLGAKLTFLVDKKTDKS